MTRDAFAEGPAEEQTSRHECSCTPLPQPEGPCAWCDVHGQPSVAWSQGVEAGREQERCLNTEPLRSMLAQANAKLADWELRAEFFEAKALPIVDAATALVEHWEERPRWRLDHHSHHIGDVPRLEQLEHVLIKAVKP